MSQEQPTNKPQQAPVLPAPVIAWEQPKESSPRSTGSNVIPFETKRRQEGAHVEAEATVTVRELHSRPDEAPLRLIVISSGFGQKHNVSVPTLQAKAAA